MNWNRVLILEVIDGKAPKSTTGLVDSRLFTGANKLHAIKDPATCLWSLRYDDGLVPLPLRQRFTTFGQLKKFTDAYFEKRNIYIKEIID